MIRVGDTVMVYGQGSTLYLVDGLFNGTASVINLDTLDGTFEIVEVKGLLETGYSARHEVERRLLDMRAKVGVAEGILDMLDGDC